MYKANRRKAPGPPVTKDVHLPADAGLSRLLRTGSAGKQTGRHFGAMSNAAHPKHSQRLAQIPASLAPVVADDLARMLARARQVGDPAADALAAFLAREFPSGE
jgi:hypothetical protein